LGERDVRNVEVSGSIPLGSTIAPKRHPPQTNQTCIFQSVFADATLGAGRTAAFAAELSQVTAHVEEF
jgi:hypothetical protein